MSGSEMSMLRSQRILVFGGPESAGGLLERVVA